MSHDVSQFFSFVVLPVLLCVSQNDNGDFSQLFSRTHHTNGVRVDCSLKLTNFLLIQELLVSFVFKIYS